MTYHIYGRTQHTDPLHFIREVSAESRDALQHVLDRMRDESEWVELISFPEEAAITVIDEGEPV